MFLRNVSLETYFKMFLSKTTFLTFPQRKQIFPALNKTWISAVSNKKLILSTVSWREHILQNV